MAKFLNNIHSEDLGYYQGRLVRRLLEPLIWIHDDLRIEIPTDFESDGASVPRVPIIYDAWGDRAHREAFGHDYGYRTDSVILRVRDARINALCDTLIPSEYILDRMPIIKEAADWLIFRTTIKDRTHVDKQGNVVHTYGWGIYQPMYLAVRTCGGSSFHRMNVADHFEVEQ